MIERAIQLTSLVLAILALGGCATTQTHTFHVAQQTAVDSYVDDATLIAAFPSIEGAGKRLGTCINPMFIPASGYIDFTPTVTGTHTANGNRLTCTLAKPDELTCSDRPAKEHAVVFDVDPAQYFHVDADVEMETALEIFRAFRDDSITYSAEGAPPMMKGLPLTHIARKGDGYEVSFGDCGCTTTLIVGKKVTGTRPEFVVRNVTMNICI